MARSVELGALSGVHTGAILLEVRGRARHVAGDTDAAIDDLRQAGEIFQALGLRNPGASDWRSALAMMLPTRDIDEALLLAHDELEAANAVAQPRAIGVALRALGVLERDQERLQQAVRVLEGTPARLELARALVELGASVRRSGERAASRESLRAGLDIALQAGATRLADRARAELQSSGAHLRRERTSGPDALTPSELRVWPPGAGPTTRSRRRCS
jgi:tetratricopeptide (TPR) repeat protein